MAYWVSDPLTEGNGYWVQDDQNLTSEQAQHQTQKALEAQEIQYQKKDAGKPERPEFSSLNDPTTGLLKSQYQNQYAPDTKGLEAYRNRALGQGPSAWANLATQQQGLEESGQKNQYQQQGASAAAGARSALASKYGLSPGAAARLATQNMRSQQAGLQNIGFQGAQARGNIGLQDEQMKNQFLSHLPELENSYAQANLNQQNINTGGAIAQNTLKNVADLNAYNKQMEVYGAGLNAAAYRNAGGGGKK